MLRLMERIAKRVEPGKPEQWQSMYPMPQWSAARDIAIRLRSIVEYEADVQAKLGPAGPQLSASGLHQDVSGAAAKLWDDSHPPEAVQTAATYVENALKATIDRRGSDRRRHRRDGGVQTRPAEARSAPSPVPGHSSEQSAIFKSRHEEAKVLRGLE